MGVELVWDLTQGGPDGLPSFATGDYPRRVYVTRRGFVLVVRCVW